MRYLARATICILAIFCTIATCQANDGYVGIYGDSAGTITCLTVPPLSIRTLYVVAKLNGTSAEGLTAAEFRIEVSDPTGWLISYNAPTASNLEMGTPLGSGAVIAFPECQEPASDSTVSLGTISVFNQSGQPTDLLVKRHSTPTNQNYQCPLFVLCDAPEFSKTCMSPSSEPPCTILDPEKTVSGDVPIFGMSLNRVASDYGLPPQARFVPLRALRGFSLPYRDPWSSNGLLLALNGPDGFCVFDAASPDQSPRQLLDTTAPYIAWSPDGRWVACEVQNGEYRSSILAVPVGGGPPITLVSERKELGHFTWAADGKVYYWDRSTGQRSHVEPPQSWRADNPGPFSTDPTLVLVQSDRLRPHIFRSGQPENEHVLSGFPPDARVSVKASLPNGRGFLVVVSESSRPSYSVAVDVNGRQLARFEESSYEMGFSATSASADGHYIVGHHMKDDGHVVLSSQLYLADANANWRVPIESAPDGVAAKFAHHGRTLAYEDVFEGVTHVGTVEITSR